MVDALASGASGLTAVKVRVLSWAPVPMPEIKIVNAGLDRQGNPAAGVRPTLQTICLPARAATDFCTKYISVSETNAVAATM